MKINARTSFTGLIAAIVALAAADAYATTRTVTSLADGGAGTLRDTIAASAANDTIVFSNNVTGTITLTNAAGELAIGRNLTIIGPGANVLAISGNNASRVFNITNANVSISGLTISNGHIVGATGTSGVPGGDAQGGGILNQGALDLNNCILNNNSAVGGNGGIFFFSSADTGYNGGTGSSGAVANQGTLNLLNCTLNNNSAIGGQCGADLASGVTQGVGGSGSGGCILNNGVLNMINCTFNSNSAAGRDSGRNFPGGAGTGGGILNQGTQTMVNCTFSSNSASGGIGGKGFYAATGGAGIGGCVWNNQSTFVVTSCTFSGNSATGGHGGYGDGGFIGSTGGAGGDAIGGGVFDAGSGSYRSTIIANNIVTGGTGGDAEPPGSPGANGSAIGPDVDDNNINVSSQWHNLVSRSNGSSGWVGSDLTGTIASPFNPLLGPLADNGGPTFTMALLTTPSISAAIDAGDDSVTSSLATDQRGHPRKSGAHVDIGAYEVNPPLSLVVSNTNDSGVSSLRQVIVNVDPVSGDKIVFAPGVSGTIALTTGELLISKNVTINGPTAAGVTVSGNSASRVFHTTAGTVNIANLTIANGFGAGAGVWNEASTLVLSNCTITANGGPTHPAGGLFNEGVATLCNCTVYSNTATYGAGMLTYSTLLLLNSTVSGNRSIGAGMGSHVGGGLYQSSGNVTIRSSIIAGNTAGIAGPDVYGTIISSGYNLIGNSADSTGFTGTGDQTGIDPLLGPLADNGGPTFTMALRVGSPAIDKGKSFGLTTDQRGQPRLFDDPNIVNASGGDGSDIGAYEAQQLQITAVAKVGNNLQLSFTSMLSTSYEVQSRADMVLGAWASLQSGIAGNGGIANTSVSNAFNQSQQFYRVHPVP